MESHRNRRARRPGNIEPGPPVGRLARPLQWNSMIAMGLQSSNNSISSILQTVHKSRQDNRSTDNRTTQFRPHNHNHKSHCNNPTAIPAQFLESYHKTGGRNSGRMIGTRNRIAKVPQSMVIRPSRCNTYNSIKAKHSNTVDFPSPCNPSCNPNFDITMQPQQTLT